MEALSKSWVLRLNCSLTPRQLCVAYGMVAVASLLISLAWALSGAWIVLPFAVIELLVLSVAFLAYARHATDHERITLLRDCVRVEVVKGTSSQATEFPRQWCRCGMDDSAYGMVRLESPKGAVQIGQFVGMADRKRFFEEFRLALAH